MTRFVSYIPLYNNCVFLNGSPALHMFATEIVISVPKWAQWMTPLLAESCENEKKKTFMPLDGKKRRCHRVCLCLRGPAENPLNRWSNTAACFLLWQPTAVVTVTHRSGARPCLVFGVWRGCKRGAKGAQKERSQIQRPSIDVSLSLGIYFGNSTGISSIMSTVNSWTENGVSTEKCTIFQMFNIVN